MTNAIGNKGRICWRDSLTKGSNTILNKKNRTEVNNNGSISLRAIFMPTMLKPHIAATKVAPKAGFPNQSMSFMPFMCFMPVSMANF